MFLRQLRGPKAEGNYREACQRMCPIPQDLRYTNTRKTPSSKCYVTFYKSLLPPYILLRLIFLSGVGWTKAGGEHFRHWGISKPGRPLQSSFSAPTQCWVLRKLFSVHDAMPLFFYYSQKRSVWLIHSCFIWATFLWWYQVWKMQTLWIINQKVASAV